MLQMSHIFVLSQPEFVTREVSAVLSGRRATGFGRWFGFGRP